jgi:HEPN domain-containing protein
MSDEKRELERQVFKWIEIAEEDITLARHTFTLTSNVPYRLIGFHSQQCAEKYLKAFLVSRLIDFPYTHSIEVLLKLTPPEFDLFNKLNKAFDLTDYAVAKRYPNEYKKLTKQEAEEAVKLAELVKETITELLEKDGFSFKDK